jgi:hypothetical protein
VLARYGDRTDDRFQRSAADGRASDRQTGDDVGQTGDDVDRTGDDVKSSVRAVRERYAAGDLDDDELEAALEAILGGHADPPADAEN